MAKVGGWECDLRTNALTWTDGVYDLFEIPRGSRVQRPMTVDLYVEDSRRQMEELRARAVRTGEGFMLDCRIRTAKGTERWMRLTAAVEQENGRPVRLFGAKQDVTQERELVEQLKQLAECDPLTGLANRRLFQARFHDMAGLARLEERMSALVLIDLDRFKQVNDRLGHMAGDACLRQFAARLRDAFPNTALVARLGGDEFAVVIHAAVERPWLSHILRQISQQLCRPMPWQGVQIAIGASIGAAIADRTQPHDPARLFAEADFMLYAAKTAGQNMVRVSGEDSTIDAAARAMSAGRGRAAQPYDREFTSIGTIPA